MIFMFLNFAIFQIIENRLLFYLIISVLQFLYYKYTNVIFLDEVDTELNEFGGIRYRAYNPNYVTTGQGYRIELDSNEIHELDGRQFDIEEGNRVYTYNSREYPRIGHPSHYDYSNNSGVVEPNHRVVVEPTKSQIEDNGYYYVSSSVHTNVSVQRTGNFRDVNTSKLSAYKEKFKSVFHKLDENLQKDYNKTMANREDFRRYRSRSNRIYVDKYISVGR
uniref:Uncharacterized protein n=1 Tax=Chrysoporthe deuterocubensis TaxID=764597 RepID=A0A191MWZ1_9PEZI|nr:hypothetical protein [Chrysoporthe deuterocubensis]AMX22190.1 hypothetical protein [Chrysoporthe deuterocubensis]